MPANGTYIVRLQHMYSPGEHAVLSAPAAVDLSTLFCAGARIERLAEFSLSGNQLAADVRHWTWNTKEEEEEEEEEEVQALPDNGTVVELLPLAIRTFALVLGPVALESNER